MKLRRVLTGIVLALALLSLPFLMAKVTHAQDQGLDSGAISSKLDQILNNQKALVSDVVLRPARAEAIYADTDITLQGLMKACEQLAAIWGQRKSQQQVLSPKIEAPALEVDASLPVQLRIDRGEALWPWK